MMRSPVARMITKSSPGPPRASTDKSTGFTADNLLPLEPGNCVQHMLIPMTRGGAGMTSNSDSRFGSLGSEDVPRQRGRAVYTTFFSARSSVSRPLFRSRCVGVTTSRGSSWKSSSRFWIPASAAFIQGARLMTRAARGSRGRRVKDVAVPINGQPLRQVAQEEQAFAVSGDAGFVLAGLTLAPPGRSDSAERSCQRTRW